MRLEACEVSAGYGGADVLHAVSMQVQNGEFVALVGPNGCGKSTLLRVLSGVLRPRLGMARLEERPLERWSPREVARRIAFVPQQEPAYFDFTVREVVLMGRYPRRNRFQGVTPADFAAVSDALVETDLVELADRPITRLSGGEHRRVLLARALAQETPLLLLDEPTAHLDILHQGELLDLARDLTQTGGRGVLAALHDLSQAAEYATRILILRAGHVLADGTPEEALTPDHLRAAYGADVVIGPNPISGRPMLFRIRSTRRTGGLHGQQDAPGEPPKTGR